LLKRQVACSHNNMMVSFVNQALAIGVVVSHVALLIGVVYFFVNRKNPDHTPARLLMRYADVAAIAIVLGGIALSLFYSRVAGFAPCILCVVQRYFLYPQIIFLVIAWRTQKMWAYTVAWMLSLGGALIALYHNYIDYGGADLFACDALGGGVSCAKRYVMELGYVTIPMMSLTAFVLLLIILSFKMRRMCHNKEVINQ